MQRSDDPALAVHASRIGGTPVSEQLHARARWGGTVAGWPAFVGSALAAGVLVLAGFVLAPTLFKGASLRSEVAEQIRATTGLSLHVDGAVRFALLPQPHIEMADLHLVDRSDALRIDADALQGEVRFLPLLVGRLELSSAILDHPRLSIDLDGQPMPSDSTIGRALRADAGAPASGSQRLGVVTLRGGTAILKSKAQQQDTVINLVDVTVDWRNLEAPATVTGAITFRGVAADVDAWVAQPSSLLRGQTSSLALRVHSAPLNLTANGEVGSAPAPQYRGRVVVSAPSVAGVLALAGYRATLPAPFANVTLTSNAVLGGGTLDLPNLHLQMDDNVVEGTLAYQSAAPRPALSGTLAAEQFSLVPFVSKLSALVDAERQWSEERIASGPLDDLKLDLRISAAHLRLPPIVIDDAALAVMTRDRRTEIALVEGKAYGGLLKGRASIETAKGDFNVRATGSLSEADASSLSWDAFGRQAATGTISLSSNLEATGGSPAALMRSMRGTVKASAREGELPGLNLGLALQSLSNGRFSDIGAALHKGSTPYDSATAELSIVDGAATVERGIAKGPDTLLNITGQADLGARRLDLRGTASQPTGSTAPSVSLPFTLGGSFDQPMFAPGAGVAPPNAPKRP